MFGQMYPNDAAEVYAKAKDLLITEGWTRGKYYREGEGYCVIGAVCAAKNGKKYGETNSYTFTRTEQEYGAAVDDISRKRHGKVALAFNDDATDRAAVIGLLDDAIELVNAAATVH